jgi:hypothetical protein
MILVGDNSKQHRTRPVNHNIANSLQSILGVRNTDQGPLNLIVLQVRKLDNSEIVSTES